MFTPVSVSISGPALSFLLYENSKCRFQQEGFLLGEIIHKETKTITDNDQQQVNVSKTIKINSMMPCPLPHYFYNGIGKIDENIIKEFLGNQFSKVVAWFKYQRVSSFKFTMRDKIIHKQLNELFQVPPDLFTCCLLINEASDNGSTHLYSQAFMRCHNNVYDKVPIHIPNLSEPNNTYKSSEPSSDTFNKILSELKIDRKNTQGLVVINRIQVALQKHIESVIEDLSEAEKYMYELEEEVKQLQIMKKLKQLNENVIESESRNNFVESTSQRDTPQIESPQKINYVDSSPEIHVKSARKPSADIDSSPEIKTKNVRMLTTTEVDSSPERQRKICVNRSRGSSQEFSPDFKIRTTGNGIDSSSQSPESSPTAQRRSRGRGSRARGKRRGSAPKEVKASDSPRLKKKD